MITVLVPRGEQAAGGTLELDEAEAHHLRVRRAEDGARVAVRDGGGLLARGTLRLSKKHATVALDEAERLPEPLPLVLGVGAGDRDRFTWLAEKGAELGVTDIVPVETPRTAAVADRLRETHIAKLNRRALEALKQCGAAWAPRVHQPLPLARFVAERHAGMRWLGDLDGAPPPALLTTEPVTVLVGPEGGFTAPERDEALAAGFQPVRLGNHILRFETAALVAACAITLARTRGGHG